MLFSLGEPSFLMCKQFLKRSKFQPYPDYIVGAVFSLAINVFLYPIKGYHDQCILFLLLRLSHTKIGSPIQFHELDLHLALSAQKRFPFHSKVPLLPPTVLIFPDFEPLLGTVSKQTPVAGFSECKITKISPLD